MGELAEVLVLVKAAPVLTRNLDETMCVAGIRVDNGLCEWIRLHPVPFRDLATSAQFSKYQVVSVDLVRSRTDRRPESWTPIRDSIRPLGQLGPDNGWADRREVVGKLPEVVMCDLVAQNRSGSGPGTPSLGVVRPVETPKLEITPRSDEQIQEWNRRAQAARGRVGLFDDPTAGKPDFEVVPWRFRYHYRCSSLGCNGHEQTIVDWEVVALWRHVRHQENWRELMKQKFEQEMWVGRDTVLFVGNQEERPWGFLVLGIFWPSSTWQPRML